MIMAQLQLLRASHMCYGGQAVNSHFDFTETLLFRKDTLAAPFNDQGLLQ